MTCARDTGHLMLGDLNEADELTLAGVAVGETDKPVYRKGAMVGDFVAVTGTVGDASLGVEVLVKHLTEEWDNQDFQNVLARTLDAEPRVKEGYFLRNYTSAMTDISDSLAVSLNDIAREGEVGLSIDLAKIPLSDSGKNFAAQVKLNLLEFALYGGGDYELVFTVNPLDWKAVGKKVDAKVIGEVCKGHGITSTNGKNIPCNGFEHFRKK